MPLTQNVAFQVALQKGNRLQIPKLIQLQFKIEQTQVLKVHISAKQLYVTTAPFYAKMDKQGRILIPKLLLDSLTNSDTRSLAGYVFDVSIQPA